MHLDHSSDSSYQSSKPEQQNGDLPFLWLIGLGLSVMLFSVQPWSTDIYQIPIQVLIVWLLLGWFGLFRFPDLGRLLGTYSIVQWMVIIMFLIVLLSQVLVGGASWLRFQQLSTGIALSLITAQAVTSLRGRRVLLLSLAVAATASSIIAIIQSFGMAEWSWRGTLYYDALTRIPSGLETYPVAYAYSVVGVGIALFGAGLHDLKNSAQLALFPPRLAIVCGGIIGAGIIVALSRSGILALIMGFVLLAAGMWYINRRFFPFAYLTIALIVISGLVIFENAAFIDKLEQKSELAQQDVRTGSSFSLFGPVIFQYPLGIPEAVLNLERHMRNPSSMGMRNTTKELKQAFLMSKGYEPHNLFLTVGLHYGLPGIMALAVFYYLLLSRAMRVLRWTQARSHQGLSVLLVIFLAANVGLLLHASFHNASIFIGEMRGWIWVGALGILTQFKEDQNKVERPTDFVEPHVDYTKIVRLLPE